MPSSSRPRDPFYGRSDHDIAEDDMARTTRAPTPRSAAISLDGLEWRQLGAFRGGRVVAVAGDPRDRQTFYMGSTGGGVWKTHDGGLYWRNVSDGYFQRASVGALAVAASDPNVIYAGMGEATIRGNVSHGDGVYRSTDGGRSWSHLGLADTRQIGKVRVHPNDPDTVYVAALGHAHGPNAERGLFRSRDGGTTWKKVLSRGDTAGAIDVSIDPQNPRILFATFWEAIRRPYQMSSGGPGSGLFKSTDGGDTWTDLSRAKGLPQGILGKVGVAVSPARADRVWAIVEAKDGAVFRSDDGGRTWERGSEDRELRQRAWYYHHIYADPVDPETVWVLNVDTWRSSDAGKTFGQVSIPHGDHHDLWIDPKDPLRMIEGNDGGATVSFNGGASWSSIYNQPTAEYYHVIADDRTPYRLYAAQQDNSTISVPSRVPLTGITMADAWEIGGGEAGHIAIRPDDPDIIFAGDHQGLLTRHDRRTGQSRVINIWPDGDIGPQRRIGEVPFNWTSPTALSPHDPNVLYTCAQYVFRSQDEGASWDRISRDLTRNDPKTTGDSGGPITLDQTGAEYYATIFAFAESLKARGVLWAGSDDGLIHVSRDDGRTWTDVTPSAMTPLTLVSIIEPSPHDPAVAYVAATRYKLDDFRPYLYKTKNYGKTWTEDHDRHPGRGFHPGDPRGSRGARPALLRDRGRPVRVPRRWGAVAALERPPAAGRSDPRPGGEGRRSLPGDAWPVVLGLRRSHAGPRARRRHRGQARRAPVHPPPDDPLPHLRRLLDEDHSREELPAPRCDVLHPRPRGGRDRREDRGLSRRGQESARRGDRHLLAGQAGEGPDPHGRGRSRSHGPFVHHASRERGPEGPEEQGAPGHQPRGDESVRLEPALSGCREDRRRADDGAADRPPGPGRRSRAVCRPAHGRRGRPAGRVRAHQGSADPGDRRRPRRAVRAAATAP